MTQIAKILIGGYLGLGVAYFHLVIFMNLLSQSFQDKLIELRDTLEEIYFNEAEMVEIDGVRQYAKDVQNLLIKRFEEFKGFGGCGYFHLGKSLLTATLTNFVTYLIVLIQFRISEV